MGQQKKSFIPNMTAHFSSLNDFCILDVLITEKGVEGNVLTTLFNYDIWRNGGCILYERGAFVGITKAIFPHNLAAEMRLLFESSKVQA